MGYTDTLTEIFQLLICFYSKMTAQSTKHKAQSHLLNFIITAHLCLPVVRQTKDLFIHASLLAYRCMCVCMRSPANVTVRTMYPRMHCKTHQPENSFSFFLFRKLQFIIFSQQVSCDGKFPARVPLFWLGSQPAEFETVERII